MTSVATKVGSSETSTPSDLLKALIESGSILAGVSKPKSEDSSKTFTDVIKTRLFDFDHESRTLFGPGTLPAELESNDTETLKLTTAYKSLEVIERIQSLLQEYDVDLPANNKESATPQVAIGTRDLGVLRTLVSIVFGWGVSPLLVALYSAPSVASSTSNTTTNSGSDSLQQMRVLILRLASLLWSSGHQPGPSIQSTRLLPTHITKILIAKYATDILRGAISVGWDPRSQDRTLQEIVTRLLNILPASQAIVSLGGVNQPIRAESLEAEQTTRVAPVAVPAYVQRATSGLLSQQVLRQDGISGVCAAVFGEGDEVAPLVKLERVARVLSAVPSHMNREAYMRIVLPRIIDLLTPVDSEQQSQAVPTSYKRAAAFTLSRMLTTTKSLTLKIISPILHGRFLPELQAVSTSPSVSNTASILTTLFTSTDPSPLLAQAIIEPILVPLYNLSAHLDGQRISDPALKESVRGLLRTWARLVGREEAISGMWDIVQGKGGWGMGEEAHWAWDVGEEGLEVTQASTPKPIPVSILQGPNEDGDLGDEEDDNPLSLRPNPPHFALLLKSLERKDVASALFVKILNEYQAARAVDTNPLKVLLLLRLVLELQQKLGSSVLTEPEHVLQFVAHAIEPKRTEPKDSTTISSSIDALRIVENDSDDEEETTQVQDDMAVTAVTLLLSILEANDKLSSSSSPLLAMIFDYLEVLTNSDDDSLRALSREARLVLISRRSMAESASPTTDAQRSTHETYQEALRLIQDPILPVRAHGLHMLRQLVVPPKPPKGVPPAPLPDLDPALVPGILDVFLQSVQEEDSFVFLNAVQGLSAMVDRLGREILQNLVRIYAVESGGSIERAELDKKVRVGEALTQVVRRCGEALGLYVDILVPPLFRVMRTEGLPTVLRSSALSILAQCIEMSPAALTPWMDDLLSGMLDILQIESVRATPLSRKARDEARVQTDKEKTDAEIDASPQSADSKLPPLRRSALLCFALIVRSTIAGVYEGTSHVERGGLWNRARTLLEYIRITDSDSLVRVQAAETLALVKQLGRAGLGLEM